MILMLQKNFKCTDFDDDKKRCNILIGTKVVLIILIYLKLMY